LRKQPPFLFVPDGNIAGCAIAGNRMKAVDTAANCGGETGVVLNALTLRIAWEAGNYEERG